MIPQTEIVSSSSSSSSSSTFTPLWPYDVFLSFRGKDTRTNFTDHLYAALTRKGIITFRDDENLEMGKSISELFTAIEDSRYVIVIISSNYANSTWCLDELAKAVECMKEMGQTLLPIFYHVHPSEVRQQTGNIEKAFFQHERAFEGNLEKVQRWRDALAQVSYLSGWHLEDGYESELIRTVVGKIFTELNQTTPSVFTDLVGMDSRVEEMLSHLKIGLDKVSMTGIWGMGGVGKTTIAQVVSERIHPQFEAYSFLANVREVTEREGLVHLQKQLLSDILLESNVDICNPEMGVRILSQRLRTKMVLIILDDVGHVKQLKALCGHKTWFGSGSRIIITSRDEHLLLEHEVDEIYEVKPLTGGEALQLFCQKSFKRDPIGEDFLKLSKDFLKYANGLPLVIQVLGSSLFRRSIEEWSSTLDKLKENPDKTIIGVLKVSYDGLQETEKKIFLDIACFFKGGDKRRIPRILESCYGYLPVIDIKVLTEKCLLTPVGRELGMHDMIQELGREIVRQESPEEVGKRSRLWLHTDIIHVLPHNRGMTAVQSILLDVPKEEVVKLNVNDPFLKMDKLRLLKIRNGNVSGNIKYLSNELATLEWYDCPLNSLPSKFQSDKLVELNMHSSRIKQLWTGEKHWSRLTFIDMSDSQYLTKTPDFTKIPNLEMLVLEGCIRLVEVHTSIGFLKNLILLNLKNCKSVETLPPSLSLKSLEKFILSACSRLKKFPEIEEDMTNLLELHLDGTAIEELPPSIGRLTGLSLLNLEDCKNLFHIPSTIKYLISLRSLVLNGCSELDDLPESLNSLECLEELDMTGTAIRKPSFIVGMKNLRRLSFRGCKDVPSSSRSWHWLFNCWWCRKGHAPTSLLLPTSISSLTSLEQLNLSDCNLMDGAIPDDLGSLISLKMLNLSGNSFVRLPESISHLSKLEELNLGNCRRLQSLPKKLPLSLRHVNADDCTSLVAFQNEFKVWTSAVSGMTTISSLISSKNQQYCTSSTRYIPNYSKTWTSSSTVPGRSIFSFGLNDGDHVHRLVDDLSLANDVLQKELELLDYKSTPIRSGCQQKEIPQWFSNIVTSDSTSISIPQGLKDHKKWMGVAVIFSVKYAAVSHIESETSNYFYKCRVKTQECQAKPVLLDWKHLNFVTASSHYLCVFHIPWLSFPKTLNESSVMWAFFETNNPCMEVLKCGIRLLYEQDVPEFVQILMLHFSTGGRQSQIPLYTKKNQQIIPFDDCIDLNEVDKATSESGWFNLVDNMLRREKLTLTSEEGSMVLLKRNIESVLPRYLQGLNHKVQSYDFLVSGSPVWFNTEVGSSVSIALPQNLHKTKKWMGFALCAALALNHQGVVKGDDYGSCQLQMGKHYMDLSLNFTSMISGKHQLLVLYIPRTMIPEPFLQSSPRQIFTYFSTNSPGVKVQFCGLRILYQQDLQEFVRTITHCILRSSDIFFDHYNELVVKDWIKLIQSRSQLSSCAREREFSAPRELQTCQRFSEDLRHWDWAVDHFACNLAGIEIPKWFMQVDKGDSAEIQLPPNMFSDGNCMGISVCASLSLHEHPNIILGIPDSEFTRDLICYLETDVAGAGVLRFTLDTDKQMWLHACKLSWFIYIPCAQFPDSWNQLNLVKATFGSNSSGLGVLNCALRPVLKEDVEDLVQTLTLCQLSAKCHHCDRAKRGYQNL